MAFSGCKVKKTWHGSRFLLAAHEGLELGVEETAHAIALEAKSHAAYKTGTLMRSYRVAPLGWSGEGDQAMAAGGHDLIDDMPSVLGFIKGTVGVEVGSWVDYACVEEQRNPALSTAMSIVAGTQSRAIFTKTLKERGLTVIPI